MPPTESASAPQLYALLIDSPAGSTRALDFCSKGGFIGTGWGLTQEPLDWEAYARKANETHGGIHAAVRQLHDLPDGSLIWTKNRTEGTYYLARVTGPWRYVHGPAAEECDIHNVRPARVVECQPSRVPRAVTGRFIGDWMIQRIHDSVTARRSAALFAELADGPGSHRPSLDEMLTGYLDDRDLEDLVCVYLQSRHGYLPRPPSRNLGIAAFKHMLRESDRRSAIIRARRGHAALARDAGSLPSDAVDLIFVFSPTDTYGPDPAPNVREIDYQDIVEFIRNDRPSLPENVEHWVSRASDDES